jgi:hypothetical protein
MKWKLTLMIVVVFVLGGGLRTVRADITIGIDEMGNQYNTAQLSASGFAVSPFPGYDPMPAGGLTFQDPNWSMPAFDNSVVGAVVGITDPDNPSRLVGVAACMDNSPDTLIFVTATGGAPSSIDPDLLQTAMDFCVVLTPEVAIDADPADGIPGGMGIIAPVLMADGSITNVHMLFASVPEPSTLVLLGMGAIGLLAYGWRKRR